MTLFERDQRQRHLIAQALINPRVQSIVKIPPCKDEREPKVKGHKLWNHARRTLNENSTDERKTQRRDRGLRSRMIDDLQVPFGRTENGIARETIFEKVDQYFPPLLEVVFGAGSGEYGST